MSEPTLDPILATRTHLPRLRPTYRPRARLLERLDAGVERGADVVLAAAPAGSGKSVVLSAWAARRAAFGPVAWLSLDEGDTDAARFWPAVIEALEAGGIGAVRLRSATQDAWTPGAAPPDAALLGHALAADLGGAREGRGATLVLDDVHLLDGTAAPAALRLAIGAQSHGTVLAFGSRIDPPLGLARLRASGRLVELRAEDLAFTTDETADLLAQGLGVGGLSRAQVEALGRRTEGWAAGLQLAALSLAGRDPAENDRFIAAFAGSHRHLLDYLVEEVVERQPAELRATLERTSIASRLTAALVEALCPGTDGQSVLDELERRHLFLVRLDDQGAWFRYHALFREGLRHLLVRREAAAIPGLHAAAAAWLVDAGLPDEAVPHALAADDPDAAARLIRSRSAAMVGRGEHATLERWIDALPVAVVERHPGLGADQAALRLITGDIEGGEALAVALDGRLEDDPSPEATWARGRALSVAAAAAGARLDWELALERGARSLALLPADALVDRCAVLTVMGRAQLDGGQIDAAIASLREARRLGVASDNRFDRLSSEVSLARAAAQSGDLTAAESGLRSVLAETEATGIIPRFEGATILAGVLRATGRLEEAAATVAVALDLGARLAGGRFLAIADLEAARIAAARADRLALQAALDRLERSARALGGERVLALAAAEDARLRREAGLGPAIAHGPGSPTPPGGPLSARELEVLRLVAQGRSNRQIAAELFVTLNTVKAHLHHVQTKLDTANRTETVARARALGLLD
jgi:LuxR family maltose regulon positive regulatory protein